MKDLLNEFDELISARIEASWELDKEEHLEALSSSLQSLTEKLQHIGSKAEESAQPGSSELDRYSSAVIHYDWMKDAKSFIVLWRDVIFEYQKSLVLSHAGMVNYGEG